MRIGFVLSVITSAGLAGCTTLSKPVDVLPISSNEIFTAIACELSAAVTANSALGNWSAGASLSLEQTSNVLVQPAADWSATYSGVKLSASPSGSAQRNVSNTTKVERHFENLATGAVPACPSDPTGFSKGLGIAAALLHDAATVDGLAPSEIKTMTYVGTFTVSRAVGGNLTFSVMSINFKFDGSKASWQNQNTLTVVFAPPKPHSKVSVDQMLTDQLKTQDQQRVLEQVIQDATQVK